MKKVKKITHGMGKKYLQVIYLIRGLYLQYINSYNSTIKEKRTNNPIKNE